MSKSAKVGRRSFLGRVAAAVGLGSILPAAAIGGPSSSAFSGALWWRAPDGLRFKLLPGECLLYFSDDFGFVIENKGGILWSLNHGPGRQPFFGRKRSVPE